MIETMLDPADFGLATCVPKALACADKADALILQRQVRGRAAVPEGHGYLGIWSGHLPPGGRHDPGTGHGAGPGQGRSGIDPTEWAMLEKFRRAKEAEVADLIRRRDAGHVVTPWAGSRPGFGAALTAPESSGIIAEYKRASPSKGDINLGVTPLAACAGYKEAGACALSVLTETQYFKGSLDYLAEVAPWACRSCAKTSSSIPCRSRRPRPPRPRPSSLSCACSRMTRSWPTCTGSAWTGAWSRWWKCSTNAIWTGPRPLPRASSRSTTAIWTRCKPDLNRCIGMVKRKATGEIWIGASGISTPEQVRELKNAGLDALLIGTALMQNADPGRGLAGLTRTDIGGGS